MIDRYKVQEIEDIFSDEGRYSIWLEIELLVLTILSSAGIVPKEDEQKCQNKAKIDLKRIKEIEETTQHEMIAFLEQLAEVIGPESRWLHYGLTSSDVMDTALSLQMIRVNNILIKYLDELIQSLKEKAIQYKYTVCIGRTHGMHALPTTLGLKFAGFYSQLMRAKEQIGHAILDLHVGQFSGAVGTYSIVSPEIEEKICEKLELKPSQISTQVLQRDRHAAYLSALAILGADLERLAVEIRHLQRTEVGEVAEPFGRGQKGSSAMPHKRNPILCERVTGMARLLRSNAHAAVENIALWHERDISHSSVERVIIPDSLHLAAYMLRTMVKVIAGLEVDEKRMAENLALSRGTIASSSLLTELIKTGLERKKAYEIIQRHAIYLGECSDFRSSVEADPKITDRLSEKIIWNCFCVCPEAVNETFRRLVFPPWNIDETPFDVETEYNPDCAKKLPFGV
jgi:adenylosuccinate lyase